MNMAETVAETVAAMQHAGQSMARATAELERRAKIIQKLETALEIIQEVAEREYDGPEDTKWGRVLAECQHALGT